jgi:hypothetical protein
MRFLFRLFLLVFFAVPVAIAGALYMALDDQPLVHRAAEITPANIERGKRILERNDPRNLKPGTVRTMTVSQTDLDLAANYVAHQYGRGSALVLLNNGTAHISATARLPLIPVRNFLNIDCEISAPTALPRIDRLRIGRLPIPPPVAHWTLARIMAVSLGEKDAQTISDVIKKVNIGEARLAVTYQWQADLPDKLRAALLSKPEQERLRVYDQRLAEVSRKLSTKNVSLGEFLAPLFKLAAERSRDGDAIAENRAALFVLTLYVTGQALPKIIPEAKQWPSPVKHTATLNGRDDFPKHFMVSAALAANAGGPFSDAVGVYKEIEDSRGGSGFSFDDIAADRAGTRFGEAAVASEKSALKLQQQLSNGFREADFMPATEDLPSFMQEAEFKRRFGGVGGSEYKRMTAEIERRVAALKLFR